MAISDRDLGVLERLQDGLPLTSRPYEAIGRSVGMSEAEVIARIAHMIEAGSIRRFGVIVRHRQLGYHANGMVVWDVPDDSVRRAGRCLASLPFVTLCYRRPRRLPDWPYNLFCMIHGKDRDTVRSQADEAAIACDLAGVPREILFSGRCFKQRGGRYVDSKGVAA